LWLEVEDINLGGEMPAGVTREEFQGLLDIFGHQRQKQGDEFTRLADRHDEPIYIYSPTRGAFAVILIWGGSNEPGVSVFSCARTYMKPTVELYRYVSGWRTSAKFAAPYLIEHDGHAAVMCEREFNGSWLNKDDSVPTTLYSTIDMVTEISSLLRRDLANADGGRLEEMGWSNEDLVTRLYQYWDVRVPRVRALMHASSGPSGILEDAT
jgi:hypothetical protein